MPEEEVNWFILKSLKKELKTEDFKGYSDVSHGKDDIKMR